MLLQTQSLTPHFLPPLIPFKSITKPQFIHFNQTPPRKFSLKCSLSVVSDPTTASTPVGVSNDKPFPAEVSRTIMELSSSGTLSMLTSNGWPLGVGVRFAVDDEGTPVLCLNQSCKKLSVDKKSSLHVQLEQCGLRTPQCTIQGSLDKPEDLNILKLYSFDVNPPSRQPINLHIDQAKLMREAIHGLRSNLVQVEVTVQEYFKPILNSAQGMKQDELKISSFCPSPSIADPIGPIQLFGCSLNSNNMKQATNLLMDQEKTKGKTIQVLGGNLAQDRGEEQSTCEVSARERLHSMWKKRFGEEVDKNLIHVITVERVLQMEDFEEDGIWVSSSDYTNASPDPLRDFAEKIVNEINANNMEDLYRFCNVYVDLDFQVSEAKMIWVDRLGFDMRLYSIQNNVFDVRIPFPREVTDEKGAKSSFNCMSQQAWEVEKNYQAPDYEKVKQLKQIT
ncbi:hypothetical protein Pint_30506 [Pistacia integerrima]|uniref:Uncharacterized protein n=1 Tax=Pistacia integerrima TaxID=434235 RepID=A0ACC0X4D5_9ROSI|nr:hypothetical protein Pint_30506 [Pistacia integerrima]